MHMNLRLHGSLVAILSSALRITFIPMFLPQNGSMKDICAFSRRVLFVISLRSTALLRCCADLGGEFIV